MSQYETKGKKLSGNFKLLTVVQAYVINNKPYLVCYRLYEKFRTSLHISTFYCHSTHC